MYVGADQMGNKQGKHSKSGKYAGSAPVPPVSPAVNNAIRNSARRIKTIRESNAKMQKEHVEDTYVSSRKYHTISFKTKHFEVDTRYTKLKPVGKGAYGVVCSAVDRVSKSAVAIKKVQDVFADLVDAKRILREVKLLTHLAGHENIVNLRDIMVGPPEERNFRDLYMVFDQFECDLSRIIESKQELSEAHVQYFLYQILRGMKWIHSAGVMHRDLKPANLLVMQNCDLAICDFGLARGGEGDAEKTEYVVTRWYRAPELLCENDTYDRKIDVWSIGLIFGEMLKRRILLRGRDYIDQLRLTITLLGSLSGDDLGSISKSAARELVKRWKFPGKDFAEEFPGTSPEARDLLRKMLEFNPEKRFTVQEALDHPYLATVRAEVKGGEPECTAGIFDDSFERQYPLETEMPKRLLQEYMYSEHVRFSKQLVEQDSE